MYSYRRAEEGEDPRWNEECNIVIKEKRKAFKILKRSHNWPHLINYTLKSSAPGHDEVSYTMVKHLSVKSWEVVHRIWMEG